MRLKSGNAGETFGPVRVPELQRAKLQRRFNLDIRSLDTSARQHLLTRPPLSEEFPCCDARVALWPLADIMSVLIHVRFSGVKGTSIEFCCL